MERRDRGMKEGNQGEVTDERRACGTLHAGNSGVE